MQKNRECRRFATARTRAVLALLAGAMPMSEALALQFDTGHPELKIRWDNTVKYNLGYRLENPSDDVAVPNTVNPNVDFGDRNFDRGLINNRLDLLSELDIVYKDYGARISAAAWYDAVYRKRHTDYPEGFAPNSKAALLGRRANDRLGDTARREMGRDVELLDAFVYGSADLGGSSLSARVGRHTQLYGETLFLGANGIAAAQTPVDAIKALSLPNAQFKEIARPVGQVSTTLQLSQVSLGAYYQFEWRPHRIPSAGSYFSAADFIGGGGDLLLTPAGPASRDDDVEGSDSGQFGVSAKFAAGSVDYGLYAARYHDKAPIPVWNAYSAAGVPPFSGGSYQIYYQENIETYGASFSTVFGETNVAGEISYRRGVPLAVSGDLIINAHAPTADNEDDTPYALGNSLHANVSMISVLPGSALWDGASLMAELAFNRLLKVTHHPRNPPGLPDVLNTTHTRDHWAARVVFQPEYFQVLPQVDMQVPISIGYGISGRSAIVQMAPEHGGDVSAGFNFDYQKTWRAGVQWTHYFGHDGPAPAIGPTTSSYASYKQYYRDRNFVTLSVQRTF